MNDMIVACSVTHHWVWENSVCVWKSQIFVQHSVGTLHSYITYDRIPLDYELFYKSRKEPYIASHVKDDWYIVNGRVEIAPTCVLWMVGLREPLPHV